MVDLADTDSYSVTQYQDRDDIEALPVRGVVTRGNRLRSCCFRDDAANAARKQKKRRSRDAKVRPTSAWLGHNTFATC